jgi:hypothetical protein
LPHHKPGALVCFARLLGTLAVMISITATGRLSGLETASAAASFLYVPIANLLGVAVARQLCTPSTPLPHMYGLYTYGYGPTSIALLLIPLGCLLAPHPASLIRVFAIALLVAFGWGSYLTYAAFRHAVGTTRLRAIAATLLIDCVTMLVGTSLFALAGQLFPLFAGGK